jgi:hypothetical protein
LTVDSVVIFFAETNFLEAVILFIQSTGWNEVFFDTFSSRVSAKSDIAHTVLTVVNFVISTFSALDDASDEEESIIAVAKAFHGVTVFDT